jgi:site-specific DNA-adenine methylase
MQYTAAPLPFQGQKRKFIKQFKDIIYHSNSEYIIDVFGGSGLLAHCAKQTKPRASVIYNDYDKYCSRLASIPVTNAILSELRKLKLPKTKSRIPENLKSEIIDIISSYEQSETLDYLTLSSNLLFSMNYVSSLEALKKQTFYNRVVLNGYKSEGYLEGVEITHLDYKILIDKYKDKSPLLILDPPYLSTSNASYTNTLYWRLSDYLDVLSMVGNNSFIYFTSHKSELLELISWLAGNINSFFNPFENCQTIKAASLATHNSKYTDIMVHNIKVPTIPNNQQKLKFI